MKEYQLPEYNKNGTEKHIVKEGSRHHVVWWDSNGRHCSEPNCEINKSRRISNDYRRIIYKNSTLGRTT
jgi:hypothetical protein